MSDPKCRKIDESTDPSLIDQFVNTIDSVDLLQTTSLEMPLDSVSQGALPTLTTLASALVEHPVSTTCLTSIVSPLNNNHLDDIP